MKKLLFMVVLLTIQHTISFAQVGIGTTNPSPSSALDINSNNSGLLIPRIGLTSTTDITTIPNPVTSLLVYNTATVADVVPGFYYWNTKWILFQDSNRSNSFEKYGEIFRSSNVNLNSGNDVPFNTNGSFSDVTLSSTNIKVTTTGDYKVTYTANFSRGVSNGNHAFYLRKNNVKISGSSMFKSTYNADQNVVTKTKIISLTAGDFVSLYYDNGDPITLFEGTSLSIELLK